MFERQPTAVKRLAFDWQRPGHITALGGLAADFGLPTIVAIHLVPHDGMTEVFQVNPDLIGAALQGMRADHSITAQAFDHLETCHRRFSIGVYKTPWHVAREIRNLLEKLDGREPFVDDPQCLARTITWKP